jgi:predicted MFS family arabinose efflux permease
MSLPRVRIAVLFSAAIPFGLTISATDVVLPLWATTDLGLSAAEWSHLRAIRFVGVIGGTLISFAVLPLLGQRGIGVLSLWAAAIAALAMSGNSQLAAWAGIAFLGAGISNGFVTFNTLTQGVSAKRQGLANSIYRGAIAGTSVVAPLGSTWMGASLGYSSVLGACAAMLGCSGLILLLLPHASTEPRGSGTSWPRYRELLGDHSLMRYMHVSLVTLAVSTAIPGFAAIHLTRELGYSHDVFGWTMTVAGVFTVVMFAVMAAVLDRLNLKHVYLAVGLVMAIAVTLMAATAGAAATLAGCVLCATLATLQLTTASIWVARGAGTRRVAEAFGVHKLLTAIYTASVMFALGWLEAAVGIRAVFIAASVALFLLTVAVMPLRVPQSPNGLMDDVAT